MFEKREPHGTDWTPVTESEDIEELKRLFIEQPARRHRDDNGREYSRVRPLGTWVSCPSSGTVPTAICPTCRRRTPSHRGDCDQPRSI